MFRDKPPFDHTSIATQQSRSGQEKLLVIPATGEKQWIQQVIEWYNPAAVILYGRPYRPGEPGATLAFWKLRHPDRLFYTSAVNGCLRLALEPDGVTVIPTISSAS